MLTIFKKKFFSLPKTLRGRLIVLPSIAVVIIVLLSGIIVGYIQYNYLYKNLVHNSKTLGGEITTTIEKYLLLDDYGEVESIMRRFCKLDMINALTLVNDDHRAIIDVSKQEGQVKSILNSYYKYSYFDVKNVTVDDANIKTFIVIYPIHKGTKTWWLRITISKVDVYSNLVNLLILATVIGLFLIIFLAFLLVKILHKPLEEIHFLTIFSSKLNNNIGKQLLVNGTIKEIDDLTISLNSLSKELSDNQNVMNDQKKQLLTFNAELTDKVNEEIAKNREKEVLLLRQSRLAALGEMIGYIAHQWRQPLNVIAVDIQNLHLSFQLNELTVNEFNESVKSTMKQINYLSNTIDNFRDIIKNDQISEPFVIAQAIYKSADILSSSLKQLNIVIYYMMDESLIMPRGSSSSFSQAIINILNNAKDAFETCESITSKVITVKIYKEYDHIVILISDNGRGIPNNIIEKIFDPYFTTKHQSNGTGLGLYITKNIIEKEFLGKLSIQSMNNHTYVRIECLAD